MTLLRRSLAAALAATVALAVGAPAAGASTAQANNFSVPIAVAPVPAVGNTALAPCGRASGFDGQAATGEVTSQVCQGAGLSFIAPATGQIATVIGPTIISPGFVGNVIVSAGAGGVGP
jgi:hypothetical protein